MIEKVAKKISIGPRREPYLEKIACRANKDERTIKFISLLEEEKLHKCPKTKLNPELRPFIESLTDDSKDKIRYESQEFMGDNIHL